MTTTMTLTREARRNVELFAAGNFALEHQPTLKFVKFQNAAGEMVDSLELTDVPVFRSGTFRDSMGFQHTWEDLHMDQMVSHFDLLSRRKILESIPVRKGHGSFLTDPMDGLIGTHTALRTKMLTNPTDSNQYLYLLADYRILDPEAIRNISSGLWINRSAEVGSYVNNAEAEFWPVYMGVAYVDFSAVEGLNVYSKNPDVGTKFSLMYENNKEAPVPGTDSNQGTPAQAQPAAAVPTPPVAAPAAPVSNHAQPAVPAAPAAHSFTINGKAVSDFAAVQAHIVGLETFAKETRDSGRKDFVKGLATANKISAAQIPQLEVFALGLSDEQWTLYAASWDAAPVQSTLGLHAGSGSTNSNTQFGQTSTVADDEIATLEGIVQQHKRAGKTQKQIEAMNSYQRLQTLRAAQTQS